MDKTHIEDALKEATALNGCDPEQAQDIITDFWEFYDSMTPER